ncbi:MAG: RNA polymerase factor sigma-54 [Planctomycetes bacterium]|nr:RNA polymerase factor sigma-54 [Planctomycetota bacterium]
MRLDVSLQQRLSQQLRLAPQIIQSIEILQLPAMDLRELIENELQENEVLEVEEVPRDPALAVEERGPSADEEGTDDDAERVFDRLEGLLDADRSRGRLSKAAGEEAADRKWEAMQNTAARGETLADHLHEQLDLLELPADVRAAADAIVYNLDDGGILRATLEEVVAGMDEPVALEVAERALRTVQGLEPAGVGARDLVECLLLQIKDGEPDAELRRRLVRDHLDDLKRNKIPRIAKALGVSVERVYELRDELRHLTPRPGAAYGAVPTAYIRPDVVVEWDEGDYVVRLVNDHVPRLALSPRYRQMLQEARGDPKLRDYVKRKVDAAKWLIEAIAQRENTLERVAKEIVHRQRDYLDLGLSHLRPLKMQEVADALGIHVSTVSRAISDKYVQTHRGIVPLKFFFTGGTENDDGGVESRVSIKERVKAIVAAEDPAHPLSDDEVAERLSKESGLVIARRTVTKYRKALRIPSSRQRRVWSG